jgi:hypothetical protein
MGKKERLLALWSNDNDDLVIQNRWREEHTGLISGEVSGDAWALFTASDSVPISPGGAGVTSAPTTDTSDDCTVGLSGHYAPEAEVVNADGSLASRQAAQQFFREELVGEHPLNQADATVTELRVDQDATTGITISLHAGAETLGTRNLPAGSLACSNGRWLYSGDKAMHSAWLLLAASAGYHWEDLTLWRDRSGALVVEGRHTQRALLLLIPFGGTETLLMAFPPYRDEATGGALPAP